LVYSPRREMAVAQVEIQNPREALRRLGSSEHPFDVWFKEKLVELHGCDLDRPQPGHGPELVFAYPGEHRPEPPRTGTTMEWTATPARE
ncbi:MAG: hypothetical protein ACRDSJ_05100, partial [Rubrobacteraceae bacterium]